MKTVTEREFPIEDFIDLCQLMKIKLDMSNPMKARDSYLAWINRDPERRSIVLEAIDLGEFGRNMELAVQWRDQLPTLQELLG